MSEMKNQIFRILTDEEKCIEFLGFTEDSSQMNWAEGHQRWGTVKCPESMQAEVSRNFTQQGNLLEKYRLKNISKFPVAFKRTDVGIYTTLNDNYEDTQVCLNQKCHAHIFCGGEAAYVMALQMGGRAPHLGLKLRTGSILSYSVERDLLEESNDRGDFILHPELPILEPGEEAEISWELFPFQNKAEFFEKLMETPGFPVVRAKQFTWFQGEEMSFRAEVYGEMEADQIEISCNGEEVPCTVWQENGKTIVSCIYMLKKPGEYEVWISMGGKKTRALFSCHSPLHKLIEKRCHFIAERQQYHRENSVLNGAYLIYDNEEEKQYYSHLDDHNGGRERICMGILMAAYLQRHADCFLQESLEKYVTYVYRELYDLETGMVYNDVTRNQEWHRLYNYPWMSIFQVELYRLFRKKNYLLDAFRTMECYYREGGKKFYGIGIPAVELYKSLQAEDMEEEAEVFLCDFREHCEQILKNGLNYPPFEVRYEQSIVAPAVDSLFQAYVLTNDAKFLEEAKRQLAVLELFQGNQADYHQFEVAIRHWDGRWFGKRRNYGDTYPHYWSALTGMSYVHGARILNQPQYIQKAAASLRGVLTLFTEDGRGSCAMVYPETVNGVPGHYCDPWANDQDWALYFALKYEEFTCTAE